MKILFIGNSRLGDAILSTPILNHYNLKKNKITVVCSPLSKEIYSSFLSVEKIIVLKKKKERSSLAKSLHSIGVSKVGYCDRFKKYNIE